MTKKPCPKAERNTQILDLIHYDICEYNGVLTRGGKRYFITFIDDSSRFTFVFTKNKKMKHLKTLNFSKLKFRTKRKGKLKWFKVIEMMNIFQMSLILSMKSMELFTKNLLLLLLNKMALLKGKIGPLHI